MAQITAALALTSCQYPADLTNERASYRSLARLNERMLGYAKRGVDRCLLLAGDIVYVDATAGLADPEMSYDRFAGPYARVRESGWSKLRTNSGQLLACLDDHELIEGWEPSAREQNPAAPQQPLAQLRSRFGKDPIPLHTAFSEGTRAFREHILRQDPAELAATPRLWSRGGHDSIGCFVMDTRTERDPRTATTIATARMFSDEQLAELLDWLRDLRDVERRAGAAPTAKFVLSGSMLLPRRIEVASARSPAASIRSDAWDGYPATLAQVLGFIARERIAGVVFVSGDEHLACTATIELSRPDGSVVTAYSIHCPPLHAPFPFANAKPWQFADDDLFLLPGTDVAVRVSATFAPVGDGFALIELHRAAEQMHLRVIHSGLDREVVHPLMLRATMHLHPE